MEKLGGELDKPEPWQATACHPAAEPIALPPVPQAPRHMPFPRPPGPIGYVEGHRPLFVLESGQTSLANPARRDLMVRPPKPPTLSGL
eukprot:2756505-Pyramimonas_sp.AAC.1